MSDVEYFKGKVDNIILTEKEVKKLIQGKYLVIDGISIYKR